MQDEQTRKDLSEDPINILFNPASISKKNVWDVDLVAILDLLMKVLEKSDQKDLRVAGMAALTSSLIYRLKVESIFALHKQSEATAPAVRRDVDIAMIGIPYRHESTYAVSLDDLLGLLENLIGTIANPRERRRKDLFDSTTPPDMDAHLISVETIIAKYENLIIKKVTPVGTALLGSITHGLESLDRIRCFFAILFLALAGRVELEQAGDDIRITLVGPDNKVAGDSGES